MEKKDACVYDEARTKVCDVGWKVVKSDKVGTVAVVRLNAAEVKTE